MSAKSLRGLVLLPFFLFLGGCHAVLLDPSGDVARQQSDLMIASAVLMSLIIVPVLVAIGVIAWRYRASNKNARYEPEWEHSTGIELVVWAAPLLIIIALGAMTWIGTHQLDPYQRLTRIDDGKSIEHDVKPLEIEAISLNWKWLFIYPQYGVATVNEVAAPKDVPIHFKLTSSSMMNSFFVPALSGQIYTMAGMQTDLNAVINKTGSFRGFSSNYSGLGFTDMRFRFHGLTRKGFNQWIAKVRASGKDLNLAAYLRLDQPSRNEPVHYYAGYMPRLYWRILNRCVKPGTECMQQIMQRDARANVATSSTPGENRTGTRAAAPSGARGVSTH